MNKVELNEIYDKTIAYFEKCPRWGMKYREGQCNMALSVFDVLDSKNNLIIEAGVGIGKSYAYLVPLLYYFSITARTFIVSTSTIALQEQLEMDIKKLSEQLEIPINVVIAKGMNNFICLNRLEEYSNSKNDFIDKFTISKQDRKAYPEIGDEVWKNINVEKCLYNKCSNCKNCEFYKRREQMRNIDGAIICNHDLLIEDLDRKNNYMRSLFRKVDFIVCDEAHNLENKIRSAKTKELKIQAVKSVIFSSLNILEHLNIIKYDYKNIINIIEKLQTHINKNVNYKIKELADKGIDLVDCNGLEMIFDEKINTLSNKLMDILNDIKDSIEIYGNDNTELVEEQLEDAVDMFRILSLGKDSNYLFWIEHKKNKNYIYYAPKNINDIAYELFFKDESRIANINSRSIFYKQKLLSNIEKISFIFTSATLSTKENDYSYFLNNIGADKEADLITIEDSYASPYNYKDNAILYCCNDIASPKNKKVYLNQLTEKIKELIKLTNGKALVLFTSKSDMNYVYDRIGKRFNNIDIYIQSSGSSQDIIKNKFKDEINSVLFSTGIFWEGIDIKGKSLSNLIIARLPFPIVDPIMEYKKSIYGSKGFSKVYLPEMLIKLKQGVGRLIRSETDKGIVCILDSRVSKYEKLIKDSLPIKNFTYELSDIKDFVVKNRINL